MDIDCVKLENSLIILFMRIFVENSYKMIT